MTTDWMHDRPAIATQDLHGPEQIQLALLCTACFAANVWRPAILVHAGFSLCREHAVARVMKMKQLP